MKTKTPSRIGGRFSKTRKVHWYDQYAKATNQTAREAKAIKGRAKGKEAKAVRLLRSEARKAAQS